MVLGQSVVRSNWTPLEIENLMFAVFHPSLLALARAADTGPLTFFQVMVVTEMASWAVRHVRNIHPFGTQLSQNAEARLRIGAG